MPKIGFPMPTAKNRFQILQISDLTPQKTYIKKKHGVKGKNYLGFYPILNHLN